jgi:3D (Asp-Asp-Asp) domain-containing protein
LLDENGKPIKYLSKTTLRATAYTHTGNKMATGKYPTPGYVAVDPKEIPYGTKMYIVSADGKYVYGYAIAADTGGFIHDTRADMDLFLDTEAQCVQFGRRDIVVYFVC